MFLRARRCTVSEGLALHCRFLKTLPSAKGIYEQQSRINHLPPTDYIQTLFGFSGCSFPFPIHSPNNTVLFVLTASSV